jgi:iron(III) transport system ATP-binding protein
VTNDVLVLERVSHAYGAVRVLDNVSLSAGPGEILCLLGPSGCGKTTALRLAAGLEELQSGRILLGGQVVAAPMFHVPPEERGVGMVFQDFALFPHLSVLDNVLFGIKAGSGAARLDRAREVLDQVGMSGYAKVFPHTLSGGQQQRVALARALAPRPRLLLLDEPFSGLDSRLRSQVRDETLHIVKESGTTTLIVTHDPEEAMYMADQIAVMCQGRVEQTGEPVELYAKPANAFVAKFFSSTNSLEGTVHNKAVDTPFGLVAAPRLRDGIQAEVLMRPEALRITPANGSAAPAGSTEAHILTVRMLRRASFLHLCLGDFGGGHLHFHCRVPGHNLMQAGDTVHVTLDRDQAFVFPVDRQSADFSKSHAQCPPVKAGETA